MEPYADVVAAYRDFAGYAAADSPTFAAWAAAVADDPDVVAWIGTLPGIKQQPNLVFAAARWHGVAAPGPYGALREALLADGVGGADHADGAGGPIRATILGRATQTNEVGRLATLVPAFARIAADRGGFRVDQSAVAANPPMVAQPGVARRLAHRLAAQQHRLDGRQCCALGQVDLEPTVEPAMLEQDRLLRQPVDMRAVAHNQPVLDHRVGAERAIDPFAGRGGQHQSGPGPGICRPAEVIAAGQSPGGVHQHRLQGVAVRVGKPDLGAALLIEAGDPRPAVANGRDNAALAAGALQGRRNGCDRERAHAHTIRCLRTSGRSRSLAGPACMISPRSMM